MEHSTSQKFELQDGDLGGHVRGVGGPYQGQAIGVDTGDKISQVCVQDAAGEIVQRTQIPTTREGVRKYFGTLVRCRVALEVGTHSRWLSQELKSLGFEVYVANARKLRGIYQSDNKTDKSDAAFLAEIVAVKPKLLCPIEHRGEQAQADLSLIRARGALIRARTLLINHVRCAVKSMGARLMKTSADAFHKHIDNIPTERKMILDPLMNQIRELTAQIRGYNKAIREAIERYPEAARLMQVKGVGPLVSLAFICTIEDPDRFPRVRKVGSYLGLRPKLDESGDLVKELRITKSGDVDLRRLLVNSAQYILGPLAPESDLRTWGLGLAGRSGMPMPQNNTGEKKKKGSKSKRKGGGVAKKKAVVAVARKLAVLLLSLWKSGQTYIPLRGTPVQVNQDPGEKVPAIKTPVDPTSIEPAAEVPVTHSVDKRVRKCATPISRRRRAKITAAVTT